jgi:hypothetical protein
VEGSYRQFGSTQPFNSNLDIDQLSVNLQPSHKYTRCSSRSDLPLSSSTHLLTPRHPIPAPSLHPSNHFFLLYSISYTIHSILLPPCLPPALLHNHSISFISLNLPPTSLLNHYHQRDSTRPKSRQPRCRTLIKPTRPGVNRSQ